MTIRDVFCRPLSHWISTVLVFTAFVAVAVVTP